MTKRQLVEQHLKRFGWITSIKAFDNYRVTRLSDDIMNLRKRMNIETHLIPLRKAGNCTHYALYRLVR